MFLGFVDVLDLTGYILNHADHGEFFSAPLRECINYSHKDPAVRVASSEVRKHPRNFGYSRFYSLHSQ
jgi:hypothetical protein